MAAPYTATYRAWLNLAQAAYDITDALVTSGDVNAQGPQVRSLLASTAATLFGWMDPRTTTHLDAVMAAQHADGGWGTDQVWNGAWGGTVNYPASTTYLITTAEHVGATLINAEPVGAVPAGTCQTVGDLIMTWPLCGDGKGARYSLANDPSTNPTVWNVSAAAALFLRRARYLVDATRAQTYLTKANGWIATHDGAYSSPLAGWPYQANLTTPRQDSGHNAMSAEATFWIGQHAQRPAEHTLNDQNITASQRSSFGEADWIIGAVRLVGLPNTYAPTSGQPAWNTRPDLHFARIAAGLERSDITTKASYVAQLAAGAARVVATYP